MREAFFDYFLCYGLMYGRQALDEGDGTAEHGDVAAQDAFHELSCRGQGLAFGAACGVGVDAWRLCDAAVDAKRCVAVVVFGMVVLCHDSKLTHYPETRTDFHIFYENPGCVSVAARISGGCLSKCYFYYAVGIVGVVFAHVDAFDGVG